MPSGNGVVCTRKRPARPVRINDGAAFPKPGAEWSWETAGTGGLNLWPLFGATNQLLGGLAFLVVLFWMWRRGLPVWFVGIPAVFMLVLPGVAMGIELFKTGGWLAKGNV